MKEIEIKCEYTDLVSVSQLDSIQGNLKQSIDVPKLAESIAKNGWIIPLFAWPQMDGRWVILDGVHRLQAVTLLKEQGWQIESVPVIKIEASDLSDAKRKLLLASSRYAKIKKAGFFQFTEDLNLEELKHELSSENFKFLLEDSRLSKSDIPQVDKKQVSETKIVKDDVSIRVYVIEFVLKEQFKEFWNLMQKIRKAKFKRKDFKDIFLAVIKDAASNPAQN